MAPSPLLSPLTLLFVGLVCAQAGPAEAQRARPAHARLADKIHPQMRRLLDERGPSKAWVYFKDKGLVDAAHLRRELDHVRDALTPRARERRLARRDRPGLVDFYDLPVARSYVAQAEATGARKVVESSWLNAISVLADARQLERIAELPFVDRIEPVRRGVLVDGLEGTTVLGTPGAPQAMVTTGPEIYGLSYAQLDQIGIVELHRRGLTGAGMVVGILDTGFERAHEAFNEPGHVVDVVAEFDFVNNDPNTAMEAGDDPSQHAHGTYILGTLAAYLPNELVGSVYDASFVLAKTEDITNEYQQEEDFYVAGLQFIEAQGADVATSSLGYIDWYTQADLDGLTATTTQAVNVATANGLICCTAAGNYGHDSSPSTSALIAPADAFDVITVGAVDSSGIIASFSSDGPSADGRVKPEVLATGVSTYTVCAFSTSACTTPVSGTSLSTPLIAGAVTLMAQARPAWTVSTIRSRLFATGDYFLANGAADPEFVLGYGIPDVKRAIGARGQVHRAPSQPSFPAVQVDGN